MAVIPARIPATGLARFYSNVIALSPTFDVTHRDETGINVDLTGIQTRSLLALVGTGARVGTLTRVKPHDETACLDVEGENMPVSELSRRPNR